MRILFRNIGQAEFFLKASKRALTDNLIAPDGGRLPTQRIRNALCEGLGYSSYDELKMIMSQRHEYESTFPSSDELHWAVYKGFSLAFAVAEGYGFRLPEPAAKLAVRLAEEILHDWRGLIRNYEASEPLGSTRMTNEL